MILARWIRGRHRRADGQAAPAVAPRFVVRVVAIACSTVVGVLAAVSAVLVLETRAVVERGVASVLDAAQRQLAVSQRDRQRETLLRASLIRSEEHTSELQSQSNLVCRLLLEKKKTKQKISKH